MRWRRAGCGGDGDVICIAKGFGQDRSNAWLDDVMKGNVDAVRE